MHESKDQCITTSFCDKKELKARSVYSGVVETKDMTEVIRKRQKGSYDDRPLHMFSQDVKLIPCKVNKSHVLGVQ